MLKFGFCVYELMRDESFWIKDNPFCNRDNLTEVIPFQQSTSYICVEVMLSDGVANVHYAMEHYLSKVDLEILYNIYNHSILNVNFILGREEIDTRQIIMTELLILVFVLIMHDNFFSQQYLTFCVVVE